MPGRDNAQCLQRWNKVLKPGLVKGPWSVEEDAMLMEMMLKGYDNWRQVSNSIPGRTCVCSGDGWGTEDTATGCVSWLVLTVVVVAVGVFVLAGRSSAVNAGGIDWIRALTNRAL